MKSSQRVCILNVPKVICEKSIYIFYDFYSVKLEQNMNFIIYVINSNTVA